MHLNYVSSRAPTRLLRGALAAPILMLANGHLMGLFRTKGILPRI